jgi:hypothetical protein
MNKICSKCNYLLTPSELFCSECGTKFWGSSIDIEFNQSASISTEEKPSDKVILSQTETNYEYKAVTFQSFMVEIMGERRKEFSSDIEVKDSLLSANTTPELNYLNQKIIPLVNEMFNYYAKQGWEYFNSIEVPINQIQNLSSHSITKELFKSLAKQEETMPHILTHYIFRRAYAN